MPSSMLSADLDSVMNDPFFTSAVVLGASSARGLLDWTEVVEKDHGGSDVFVRKRVLTIRTGALGAIVNGATLTIEGTTYTVHDTQKRDDGLLTDIIVVTA
jgi:hypothetical protein